MPTDGNVEVPLEDSLQAVVVVPSAADSSLSTAASLPALPPLRNIWACPKVQKGEPAVPKKGKTEGWRCLHCGEAYYPVHAPRALYHTAQQTGGGIAICAAVIPEREKERCVLVLFHLFSCAL